MGRTDEEATAGDGAGDARRSPPPRRVRPLRKLSPRLKEKILLARAAVPWLGLRRLARALNLSLHQVRQVVAGAKRFEPRKVRKKQRCPTCGAMIRLLPCVACAARAGGK